MSEGVEQGRVTVVRTVKFGSYLTQAHSTNATTLFVEDAADFNDDGGFLQVNAVQYQYDSVDYDADTIHLTGSGLTGAAAEDDRVDVFPLTFEKQAVVLIDDNEDTVTARIPHDLYASLAEGIRVETAREAAQVVLDNDEWVVDDLPGLEPSIDGNYLTPGTVPSAPNNAPPSSPAPSVINGVTSLHVRWNPIDHDTAFKVQVHVSVTDGFTATLNNSATLAGEAVNGTSFTISVLPDGSPLVAGTVYYVRTIAHNSAGVAAQSTQAEGQLRLIDSPDISASAIWAGQVTADSIIGGTINVDVGVVGSLKATGSAGESVELSGAGFFVKGPSGTGNPVLVEFPTDGANPNIISGTLQASTLQVNGQTLLLGNTGVANGAVVTLSNAVTEAKAGPSSIASYQTTTLLAPTPPSGTSWKFIVPGGCVSDGTHLYWIGKTNAGTDAYYLCKSRLDGTSTGNAFVKVNTSVVSTSNHANRIPHGCVIIGTKVYVPCRNYTDSGGNDALVLRRYLASDLSFETEVTMDSSFFSRAGVDGDATADCGWAAVSATDGTDVFIGYASSGDSDEFRVRRYNTSGVEQQQIVSDYLINPHLFSPNHTYTLSLMIGTFDFGATRYLLNDGQKVRSFSISGSTLTRVSNEDFELPTTSPSNIEQQLSLGSYGTVGYFWDGTRFRSLYHFPSSAWTSFSTFNHSTTKWTTESAKWWISQTVWDNTNSYETVQSPKTIITTMKKRAYLHVTTAANNIGGARVYVGRGSTEPASTAMWRQATLTGGTTSAVLDSVAFSGTNPPTSSNFPVTTPSKIVSQQLSSDSTPSISLGGDGIAKFDTVILRGTSDATTSAGNAPALRIGDLTGFHLRIDGNEILAMSGDATQDRLLLNQGGFVRARGFVQSGTCAATPSNSTETVSVTFASAFPSTPKVIIGLNVSSPNNRAVSASSISTTGFTANIFASGSGASITAAWIAHVD